MRLNSSLTIFITIGFLASLSSFDSLAVECVVADLPVDMMLGCVSEEK
jgi:fluoride ion exporter CrcB/FEX